MASGVSGMLQHFCSGCQVRPGISLILSIRSRAKGVMIDRRPGSPHRTSIGRAALIGQHAWPPVAPSTTIRSVNPYAVLLGRTAATVRAEMEPVHRSTRACDEQRLRDITGRGPGPFVSRVGGLAPSSWGGARSIHGGTIAEKGGRRNGSNGRRVAKGAVECAPEFDPSGHTLALSVTGAFQPGGAAATLDLPVIGAGGDMALALVRWWCRL